MLRRVQVYSVPGLEPGLPSSQESVLPSFISSETLFLFLESEAIDLSWFGNVSVLCELAPSSFFLLPHPVVISRNQIPVVAAVCLWVVFVPGYHWLIYLKVSLPFLKNCVCSFIHL